MEKTALPKSSTFEKIIHGVGGAASQFVWTFMAMYISVYYTNSVGIGAAVVGTMMLVARLLDGISDIIFAWVIKHVHWKSGKKITPWFFVASPLLAIGLISCFHVPATFSETGKVVYIYVTYCFTAAVSYTIYCMSQAAAFSLITYDPEDRNKTSSMYMFILVGGCISFSYVTPILLGMWGGQTELGAWGKISVIYGLVAAVGVALMGLFLKEKEVPAELIVEENAKGTLSFGQLIKILLSNKYTWILFGIFTFYYLSSGSAGIMAYFFMYIHGDFEMKLYSNVSLMSTVVNLAVIVLTPALAKKLSSRKLVISGLTLAAIMSAANYFVASSVPLTTMVILLRCLGQAPMTALLYTYIADLTDIIRVKANGEDPSEVVSMCSSVGTKIGSGVGAALVTWSLSWVGWEATAAVQTEAALNGINLVNAALPCVANLICLIFIILWKPKKSV